MKKFKVIGSLLLIFTLLTGCSSSTNTPIARTVTVFDTVVTIQIYDKNADSVLSTCIQMCQDYEKLFSRTLEGSEIYTLNHAKGEPVEVSDETLELLNLALEYCELSQGTFDITLGALSDLWNVKENPGIIPETAAIENALSHSGYDKIVISDHTVQLLDPELQVDLGGIAKGFIADKLKSYLQEEGISHALINLGGNVLALGGKPDGTAYNIGIQKPFDETGEAACAVKITEETVVTSGIYQRYFKLDDRIYHHIFNPQTGYPYDNDLLSVTIICDSSARADALSTTSYAMGFEKGMEFINSLEDVEAIFITTDYELHYTKNFTH